MDLAIRETWGIENALDGVSFAGATDSAVTRGISEGRPRGPMWECYQHHLAQLLGEQGVALQPLPGVLPLLDALDARGARLGLLTGNMRGGACTKLAAADLLERFDLDLSAFA